MGFAQPIVGRALLFNRLALFRGLIIEAVIESLFRELLLSVLSHGLQQGIAGSIVMGFCYDERFLDQPA